MGNSFKSFNKAKSARNKFECCGKDVKHLLRFGVNAMGSLETRFEGTTSSRNLAAEVPSIIKQSVPNADSIRGERGAKTSTQMLQYAYTNGLFTLGDVNSPTNREIVPALKFIFGTVKKMKKKDPKRVAIIRTLVDACQDCQQVQAREILRLFGEMTNQNATFRGQILFFFAKQKEEALYRLITEMHSNCDLPHTKVSPGQQRAHLKSAYLNLLGESFGMTGVNAARADRFLSEARGNMRIISRDKLIERLMMYCCPERLIRELLYDINNQSRDAERLISPKCIFDWVKKNMSLEKAHHVFYDEDRAEDYKGLDPDKPKDENSYEPFLSPKFLTEILFKMRILREPGDEEEEKEEEDFEVIDLCGSSSGEEEKTNSTTTTAIKKRNKKRKSRKRSKKIDTRPQKWQINLDGSWKDYDNVTSTILESAFQQGSSSCPYAFGRWSYILDFRRMLQINTSTNRTRPVRRIPRE
jgi:hypothetical protein